MAVRSLKFIEFSAFEKLEVEFCPGINVFIGENATGKSHLMKAIYSLLPAFRPASSDKAGAEDIESRVRQKLQGVFKPDDSQIGHLIRRERRGRKSGEIHLRCDEGDVSVKLTSLGRMILDGSTAHKEIKSVFLPAREALSLYEGFIAAYEGRELSVDETYYDLCVALSANPLRGAREKKAAALAQPLEDLLGGTGAVRFDGGRFYVQTLEAHLVAEGLRKIASIVRLIVNGSLAHKSVLFWDEPEANLNPKLISRVAEFLRTVSAAGVQVFLATHDYLLTHELSLAVEYKTPPETPVRFFALSRSGGKGPVCVQRGDTLAELDRNPILEEFAAHYDRERALFNRSRTKPA